MTSLVFDIFQRIANVVLYELDTHFQVDILRVEIVQLIDGKKRENIIHIDFSIFNTNV